MSERKIRLTLSGTVSEGQGPIIDVDFNNENLDVDLAVTAIRDEAVLIKEYTVDVAAGTYNLDITFKNDSANDNNTDGIYDEDRNLVVEKVEIANDGINYNRVALSAEVSSIAENAHWRVIQNPEFNPELPEDETNMFEVENPAFDSNLPRTDYWQTGYVSGTDPGSNPAFMHEYIIDPIVMYTNGTLTVALTFS